MISTLLIAAVLVAGSLISLLVSWLQIRKAAKLEQLTTLLGVVKPIDDAYGPIPTNKRKNKVN
jgi:hypothetical protein